MGSCKLEKWPCLQMYMSNICLKDYYTGLVRIKKHHCLILVWKLTDYEVHTRSALSQKCDQLLKLILYRLVLLYTSTFYIGLKQSNGSEKPKVYFACKHRCCGEFGSSLQISRCLDLSDKLQWPIEGCHVYGGRVKLIRLGLGRE